MVMMTKKKVKKKVKTMTMMNSNRCKTTFEDELKIRMTVFSVESHQWCGKSSNERDFVM